MYALNGSWCRFTNWNATCFCRMGNSLYFGTAGKVVKAYTGTSDNGASIMGEALASFQYHGGMSSKRYTLARPIISVENPSVGISLGLNVDFDQTAPTSVTTVTAAPLGIWDSGSWDVSNWGGNYTINKSWQTVGGIGYCAALHMKVASSLSGMKWQSVDYVYERGNGL